MAPKGRAAGFLLFKIDGDFDGCAGTRGHLERLAPEARTRDRDHVRARLGHDATRARGEVVAGAEVLVVHVLER